MKPKTALIAATLFVALNAGGVWAIDPSDDDHFIAAHIEWLLAAQTGRGLTPRECILLRMLGAAVPPECDDPAPPPPPEPEGPQALTLWWVVFNAPESCATSPCGVDDLSNPDAAASVFYATGAVTDDDGNVSFVASLYETDLDAFADLDGNTSLAGPAGLLDAEGAEIHPVVRTHGPALLDDPEGLAEQLTVFLDSACEGAGGDFPCADIQFAIHPAAESGGSPVYGMADGAPIEGAGSQLFRAPGVVKLILNTQVTPLEVPPVRNLTLQFDGLENLGEDFVYEGWIISGGTAISTGVFTVDDAGDLSQSVFPIDRQALDAATAFVLTIEPAEDDDPGPSDVHILAGDFSGTSAPLSVSHPAALGDDFSAAAGRYILATPTSSSMDDEYSGVWFVDISTDPPSPGLSLPTLPAGWAYEGWVVIDGIPVTTGTFLRVDEADDNASTSPFKGDDGDGPPFPGEDFIQNAPGGLEFPVDLRGGMVVISIEPVPDNSPAPFTLKPLAGMIPADAEVHTVLELDLNLSSFPTGTVTR